MGGGFLEILAASIMYKRPVHVHVMDIVPEYKICYNELHIARKPIMLSYEGGNHYNAVFPAGHSSILSRPGVAEMMVLSAVFIDEVRKLNIVLPNIVAHEELNMLLERKIKTANAC